ncbi:MAG: DNA repair protein RadC [Pseudomonadota bacterium]
MAINQWAASERPREKLLRQGARHLTDGELLAIVIGSGIPNQTALDLARQLLEQLGNLHTLVNLSLKRWNGFKGLGPARYACLQAGLEIARRSRYEPDQSGKIRLTTSELAANYAKTALSSLTRETFACLFLDTQNTLIAFEIVSEGTIDRAVVYPREIVRLVIEHQASAVIFCHNHPSGNPSPSEADKAITKQLVAALALIEVKVLDHLIVAAEQCTSLADLGLIP